MTGTAAILGSRSGRDLISIKCDARAFVSPPTSPRNPAKSATGVAPRAGPRPRAAVRLAVGRRSSSTDAPGLIDVKAGAPATRRMRSMSPRVRHRFACLALVATLLLALVPATGRWVGASARVPAASIVAPTASAGAHAMTGGAIDPVGRHDGRRGHGAPGGHAQADCGYCLLHPVLRASVVHPDTPAIHGDAARWVPIAHRVPRADRAGALGSRGPPGAPRA